MSGSSNIQQFNPTAANQLTDAQYTTDTTRTSGAGVDAIWPSQSANKTLFQSSTVSAALAQALANKGYTVSDSNLAVLTSVMSNIQTSADILDPLLTVAYSATPVFNCAIANGFEVNALTGNMSPTFSGFVPGQIIVVIAVQDGVGGHTITWPVSTLGAFNPDPTAFSRTAFIFKVDSGGVLCALAPGMSLNGIVGTPIGAAQPSTGAFTALTGPTVASSDNSTKAATTAWAKYGLSFSLGASGYLKLPAWLSGLTLQWGSATAVGGTDPYGTLTFPIGFATTCVFVGGNANACINGDPLSTAGDIPIVAFDSFTTSSARWRMDSNKGDGFGTVPLTWFAVGY